MQTVFIAGCGYIGERLARHYRQAGCPVIGMVRSPDHAARLEHEGLGSLVTSLDEPLDDLPSELGGSILFYLVPPPGGGIADSRARNFIARIPSQFRPVKIIYMSATSVYSASGGEVVTEQSPAFPETAMGKRRLDAETAFFDYGSAHGIPVVILRVSGIYGPGRLPLMQISQGQPLLNENESGPSNRIQADDLATICIAAAEHGAAGDVFNVSDGHPLSMTTYFNACADVLGMPRQPQVALEEARQVMSPLMFSYVSQSRIVDNSLMLERLKVTLRYDSLADGLSASVGQGDER